MRNGFLCTLSIIVYPIAFLFLAAAIGNMVYAPQPGATEEPTGTLTDGYTATANMVVIPGGEAGTCPYCGATLQAHHWHYVEMEFDDYTLRTCRAEIGRAIESLCKSERVPKGPR